MLYRLILFHQHDLACGGLSVCLQPHEVHSGADATLISVFPIPNYLVVSTLHLGIAQLLYLLAFDVVDVNLHQSIFGYTVVNRSGDGLLRSSCE